MADAPADSSGGVSGTAILGALMMGYNLLSAFKKDKKQKLYINNAYANTAYNINKRKNLLEQQLASKRAQLGSMGISNSKSASAVQGRIAREAFDDINNEAVNYNYKVDTAEAENREAYRQGLVNALYGVGQKLIK